MSHRSPSGRRNERGVVIIWTAFFLMMMLGFVAIGIDVAKLMATRTQLQNAADAAALAGASAIDVDQAIIVQDTAVVRAQAISALNKAFVDTPKGIMLAAGDVTFPAANQVQVTVRRNPESGGSMATHVAQVLGITALEVKATAVAEVDRPSGVCEGLVPLGAIEWPVNFRTGCDTSYVLKVESPITPGNFLLLDFPPCEEGPCQGTNGGNEIRCEVGNGYGCCIEIGDYLMTKPGGTVGAFRQGIDDRWSQDTDQRIGICYEDYNGNGKRVIIVPIFKEWDPNGKKPVKVEGFAAFFLRDKGNGKDLTGEFINYPVVGEGGGPGGTGSNTLVYIHLVK